MKQNTMKTYKHDVLNRLAYDETKKLLIADEVASKVKVCLNIGAIGRATQINWDMIRKELELTLGAKLVTLNELYFARQRMVRRKLDDGTTSISKVKPMLHAQQYPKEYVAGIGHGRFTAGYALPTYRDGLFTREKMKQESSKEGGTNGGVSEFGKALLDNAMKNDLVNPRTLMPYGVPPGPRLRRKWRRRGIA